jgi:drug/metabolite transporter (DMT)-like permease
VKGLATTIAGVLVLSPDALLLRLISADHWTILFWRGLGISSAMGIWLLLRHGREAPRRLAAIRGVGVAVAGVLALATTCFVTAVTHTAVADALVLYSTAPLFAVAFSLPILGERVPWHTGVAVVLGTLAIALTVSGGAAGTLRAGDSLVGNLAALGAAACWGLIATLRRLGRDTDVTPPLALAGLLVASLALPGAAPLAVSSADAGWLLILCLVVIPVSFALITLGPRHLPAPEVALILLLELVLAPLWVWLALGERPTAGATWGGLLLLVTLAANTLLGARGARPRITREESYDRALAA